MTLLYRVVLVSGVLLLLRRLQRRRRARKMTGSSIWRHSISCWKCAFRLSVTHDKPLRTLAHHTLDASVEVAALARPLYIRDERGAVHSAEIRPREISRTRIDERSRGGSR